MTRFNFAVMMIITDNSAAKFKFIILFNFRFLYEDPKFLIFDYFNNFNKFTHHTSNLYYFLKPLHFQFL